LFYAKIGIGKQVYLINNGFVFSFRQFDRFNSANPAYIFSMLAEIRTNAPEKQLNPSS